MTARPEDAEWLLKELTAAVERLSDSPDEQLSDLAKLGSPGSADELALELDDVLGAACAVPGLLTERQRHLLQELDQQLAAMSGPDKARLWCEDALRSAEEWVEVRAQARAALDELRSVQTEAPESGSLRSHARGEA